ncbi:hypothetical protein O181_038209 [Austropuccinia psidii MF-1]|uniref:Retroviral polymerase SH3-like domain-containing protein n=1 Tax=Austropuccinia psidii MF-1 TaxID=1389203 RepID=A0A9Q3D812_9BASI|nr:hypothetical protein [Austropuccinia psidii MF-1]
MSKLVKNTSNNEAADIQSTSGEIRHSKSPTITYKLLRPNLLRDLTTWSISETLEKCSVEPLTSKNVLKWSTKVKMALTIKSLDQLLKNEWVKSMPKDSSDEEMEFFQNSCCQIYSWVGNSLNQENFDKFFNDNQEEYNPSFLWTSIKEHYSASSLENCAAIATKHFGMRIEEERISDSIIEIHHQSKLLKATEHHWWGVAVSTSTYLLNRTPVCLLNFETPIKLIFGSDPKLDNIHTFGCTVFIQINKLNLQTKLTPRAAKGSFLGYTEGHKNYRVYNSILKKVQIAHECLFDDEDFIRNKNHASSSSNLNIHNSFIPSTSLNPQEVNQAIPIQNKPPENSNDIKDSPIDESISDSSISYLQNSSPLAFKTASEPKSTQEKSFSESTSLPSRKIKRSNNTHLPKGCVMDTVPEKASRDITSNIDSSNIIYEKRQQFAKAAALFNYNNPGTYIEALSSSSSEDWKRAIDNELASIEENQVWLTVPIPNEKTSLDQPGFSL